MGDLSAEGQLDRFMARFSPEIIALAQEILAKMRRLLPGAVQMVYDNYNALVIGFGPTERPSQAVFSVVLYPRWVTLFFLEGAFLPDPDRLLKGNGKQVRRIILENAAMLDRPAVRTLMKHAIREAEVPFSRTTPGRLIIKSVSAKQRPRRPREDHD